MLLVLVQKLINKNHLAANLGDKMAQFNIGLNFEKEKELPKIKIWQFIGMENLLSKGFLEAQTRG